MIYDQEPLTGFLAHLKTSILLRQMSSPSKVIPFERFTRSRKLRDLFGKITDTIIFVAKILLEINRKFGKYNANLYALIMKYHEHHFQSNRKNVCINIVHNKDCELCIVNRSNDWSNQWTTFIEFKKNSRQFLEAYQIKEANFIKVR